MCDKDATIILVTDIHVPHTKVSVSMKLKQAAGRLRSEPAAIIHLTNQHHVYTERKLIQMYKSEFTLEAGVLLKQYEEYLDSCKERNRKPDADERLDKYAVIDKKTKKAEIHPMKLDQQINQAYSCEVYNNIQLIKQEWEAAYYDVRLQRSELLLETNTTMKRKSKAQQLKEDYQEIQNYRKQQKEGIQFYFGETPEDKIRSRNPLAYQAVCLLAPETVARLKYNVKSERRSYSGIEPSTGAQTIKTACSNLCTRATLCHKYH